MVKKLTGRVLGLLKKNVMRTCFHRGSQQIGGSCVEVESAGRRIHVDLGLPLDAEEDGSKYSPEIKGLKNNEPSLLGILFFHPLTPAIGRKVGAVAS
jgi:ribonuclease J